MSLDAGKASWQRIEEAVRNTLADFEIPTSLAVVSIQHVESIGIFELRIALMQGSPFVWSGRIRADCFEADLRANIAALTACL